MPSKSANRKKNAEQRGFVGEAIAPVRIKLRAGDVKLGDLADVTSSESVERVNLERFARNLADTYREIVDELRQIGDVEERRKLILEKMNLSKPSKLGRGGAYWYSWALPAFATCPGHSGLCEAYCYAAKGRYAVFRDPMRLRTRNLLATLLPEFPEKMRELISERLAELERELEKKGLLGKYPHKVIRLHDSGDFFSISWLRDWLRRHGVDLREAAELLGVDIDSLPDDKYVRDWAEVVKSMPDVQFYTYTRAWRDDKLMRSIEEHLLPNKNFTLYLSVDKTMSPDEIRKAVELASKYENVKLALTGMSPENLKQYGVKAATCPDIILTKMRKGAAVEQREISGCPACRICPYHKTHVVFPLH